MLATMCLTWLKIHAYLSETANSHQPQGQYGEPMINVGRRRENTLKQLRKAEVLELGSNFCTFFFFHYVRC